MKIVAIDNYARDNIADLLVAEHITNKSYAEIMCKALNDRYCADHCIARQFQVWEDSRLLSYGMEDDL